MNIEGTCWLCGTPVFTDSIQPRYQHTACDIARKFGIKEAIHALECWNQPITADKLQRYLLDKI
jgi:hypothetical protein